ncbi:16832_t:CDS:2, partial [Racocetra persica]
LTENIRQLKADKEQLETENSQLKLELGLLKGTELSTLATKLAKVRGKSKARKAQLGDLDSKLKQTELTILSLGRDNEHLIEVKKSLETKVNELTKQEECLEADKLELEAKLETAEKQISELTEVKSELETKLDQEKDHLNDLNSDEETKQETIKQQLTKIEELEKQKKIIEGTLEKTSQESQTLQKQLDEKTRELKEVKDKLAQKEAEIKKIKEGELADLENKIEILRSEELNETEKKHCCDFFNNTRQVIIERNSLKQELSSSPTSIEKLEKTIAEFKTQCEETNQLLEIANNEKSILENQQAEFKKNMGDLTDKIVGLEKLLEDKNAYLNKLENKDTQQKSIKDLEDKVNKLDSGQFTEEEKKVASKMKELIIKLGTFNQTDFTPSLNLLKSEKQLINYPNLTDLPFQLRNLGETIDCQISNFNKEKKHLENIIAKKDAEIKTNTSNRQAEKSKLNGQISTLNSQVSNLRSEANRASGLQSQVYSLQSQLSSLRSKSVDNQTQCEIDIVKRFTIIESDRGNYYRKFLLFNGHAAFDIGDRNYSANLNKVNVEFSRKKAIILKHLEEHSIDNRNKKNGISSDLINAKREELKNLNIEPVSVAKFFYEKGAKNIALIQRLIYLAFLKVLQEKNILLFAEE